MCKRVHEKKLQVLHATRTPIKEADYKQVEGATKKPAKKKSRVSILQSKRAVEKTRNTTIPAFAGGNAHISMFLFPPTTLPVYMS